MGSPHSRLNMNEHFSKFIVGAGSPVAGILVSLSTYNEQLQTVSLCIGILVGAATLINIVSKWLKR